MRFRPVFSVALATLLAATGLVSLTSSADAVVSPVPRRIMGGWLPYWTPTTSSAVAVANADLFSDASPFWHSATSATAVSYQLDGTSRSSMVAKLHAAGIPVIPSVTDGTPAHTMAAILANPTTRAQHVNTLVSLVLSNYYDGIDLDYERFAFSDGSATWPITRPNWVLFVRDLSAALHAHGKKLTVAVPAMYDATRTGSSGYWVYDYAGIAPYVDRLRVMAYDYSFSVAGPIAPISWVRRVVTFAVSVVPSSKIQLGVPTYGYDWPASTVGCPVDNLPKKAGYTAQQAMSLSSSLGVVPTWSPTYGERTFSYAKTYAGKSATGAPVSCRITRTVWYDDAASVLQRAKLIGEFSLGGIAAWTVGGEDPAQWAALRAYAKTIAPTVTHIDISPAVGRATYGSPLTLTGVIRRADGTGVDAVTLSLLALSPGALAWTPVVNVFSAGGGVVHASVTPAAGTTYRWWYRGAFGYTASVSGLSAVTVEIPGPLMYVTPGFHTVSGQEWFTRCEASVSASTRCYASMKTTIISTTGHGWVATIGYQLKLQTWSGPSTGWTSSVLARTGKFTASGLQWTVSCTPNAVVGARVCVGYVWRNVISRHKVGSVWIYTSQWSWVLNDVVRLTA